MCDCVYFPFFLLLLIFDDVEIICMIFLVCVFECLVRQYDVGFNLVFFQKLF